MPNPWTAEDAERAALEGWRFGNNEHGTGALYPVYDSKGMPVNAALYIEDRIMRSIIIKGQNGSEWHKQVYLFHGRDPGNYVFEIQRLNDICAAAGQVVPGGRFVLYNMTEERIRLFSEAAEKGDLICQKLLAHIALKRLTEV